MRVSICEDHALLREGLVRLLEAHECEVLSATADADAFLASLAEARPDVCVLDVRLPPGSATRACGRRWRRGGATRGCRS